MLQSLIACAMHVKLRLDRRLKTSATVNDDARKHNQNLPGMGGVFNLVNLHVYHYAGYSAAQLRATIR
jgi:hypothetical protein